MAVFSRLSGMFRNPAFVSATQSGLLMCAGDLISQKVIERRSNSQLDMKRTLRFGLIGFAFVGPILRSWYQLLERRIVMKTPGWTATMKMISDQVIFAPIFLVNFMTVNDVLQGLPLARIKEDFSLNYTDILISNYKLWPAVQMITFWVIPLAQRVLFVQSCALFWNTYLSWRTNQPPTALSPIPLP